MAVDVQFDFYKANNLLNTINEFENSLSKYVAKLDGDVAGFGTWWVGPSYGEYNSLFAKNGGGKSALAQIADNASVLSSYLVKTAEAKRTWEKNGSKKF